MANAYVQKPPLTLAEYAEKANQTDRFAEVQDGETKLAFGFFGEVGGLLAAVKKVSRDQLRESETEVAGEEIGDALWYLFALATAKKLTLYPLAGVAWDVYASTLLMILAIGRESPTSGKLMVLSRHMALIWGRVAGNSLGI